ncbi:PTS sugar transporter subunit IIA [Edwardsiella ictaluri]|uniref:PTS sugar transporter subunit IIA n=1 Tax=Edwardsiella ictaluri TaxID=67780 RepID=A0ABY8GGF8_EDWIC|nr:PTS sugar transporter subunit IIA [Edwardsiella ictaluri]ARD38748.1 transcriptional regulator [Edwardsiella ictaluri]ELV7526810.1 PTS sugar transporter subunit IIA [Edwardsiella ictaluri]KMQ78214.1 transcriptional regulator [Edwardsiella ictaluri]QPW27169.1 PTS transporter subunit EIIA [Edwardsiella ictaluri]WFN96614.1 PTS sugar transporter subunit IIA [Edwardsiella ictaluri]
MSIDATLDQRWQYCHQPLSWRHAIHLACQPLISDKKISAHYPLHIIDSLKRGKQDFMVRKGVMLVFAQPQHGVLSEKGEASVLKCDKPVVMPDGAEVTLIITLSAGTQQALYDLHGRIENWLEINNGFELFTQATSQNMLGARIQATLLR